MTQQEIIDMARQAEIIHPEMVAKHLEAFAKLVAEKERTACAMLCEDNATDLSEGDWDSACNNCADHIRARGQA